VWLILARPDDGSAAALARRWGERALLLTPGELHRMRWRLSVRKDGTAGTGVAGPDGRPVSVAGVLCRLGGVMPADLPHVHPDDREYAAAELTAFLLAWLDACPAPVLNRPRPGCLNGPAWYPEQWSAAASAAGLRVAATRTVVTPPGRIASAGETTSGGPEPVTVVRVVRDAWFGPVHPEVGRRVCRLARTVGTPLLAAAVHGSGPDAPVAEVSAWPEFSDGPDDEPVAAAVAAALAASEW
jgi:hypothetical protein